MRTPEDAELFEKKEESIKMSCLLAEKERTLEKLKISVAQFQQRYNAEISQKYVELKSLTAIFSPYGPNSKSSTYRASSAISIEAQGVRHNVQETKEAKKVYRSIAAVIHPDKATATGSHALRTRLMAALNDAYQRKDVIGMQRLFSQWQESPEAVEGEGSAADLLRMNRLITLIKKRLADIDKEIFRITHSDIYRLMLKASEGDKRGRDILAEMSTTINKKILDAQNQLLLRLYG